MKRINWEQFEKPNKDYRAKPFWALNGKLEKRHLKYQIKCMKKMGFGGAFLHSRTGLETEYMSDEWLDLIEYAVEELKRNGMDAYLYDEDRWPSGTCGGLVTRKKEYRAKAMVYDEVINKDDYTQPNDFLGLFAVCLNAQGRAETYRKIESVYETNANERVFVFYYVYMQCDSFYNGFTYVDTMYREATDCFISYTHEKYKAKMGNKFGREIVGIFTDEPHRGPFLNGFGHKGEKKEIEIPYTYALFDEFFKRKGYRIEDSLPLLWFGKADEAFCKETYDLIEIEQELFLENFAKPYYDWCKENRLIVTGHVLHEDNLASQTTMCGSVMRYYEYMDYPGMDNLCERNYAYNVPALVNSVAKQLGKDFVLDELYGATGWQMRFSDYKHTGDWQSASGVSLRCPHLSWYTMKGEAKRDYPASILHQSAWYEDFSVVEDYFSRLQYLLSCGEDCTDVAIINPIESVWGLTNEYTYVNCFATTDALYQRIEKEYYELYKGLLLRGACVDYVDEGLFSKYGFVENGNFCCGKKRYETILLNGNLTLRESTVSALNTFLNEGGHVLIVGERPHYIDGLKSDFSLQFLGAEELPFDIDSVYAKIADREIETNDTRLIVRKRDFGEEKLVFLLNSEKEQLFTANIRIKTSLDCDRLNLRTGKREGIEYRRDGDYIVIEKTFDGGEECMLFLSKDRTTPRGEIREHAVTCPNAFSYALNEPNVLVLDNAEYFIDGKSQGRDYVLNIDRAVRKNFGLETRHGEMIQPWFKKKYFSINEKNYGKITLKYTFNTEYIPDDISLMAEDLDKTEVYLNGKLCVGELYETTIDNAFRLLKLPTSSFVLGENILEIAFDFYERFNIEGVFLCGDFGVRCGETDVIVPLSQKLSFGDLSEQGLPYYGGRVKIFAKFDNGIYMAKTKDLNCALLKINDSPIAFMPYETIFVVDNERIEIEMIFTRNNTFGCSDDNGKHTKRISQGLVMPLKIQEMKG